MYFHGRTFGPNTDRLCGKPKFTVGKERDLQVVELGIELVRTGVEIIKCHGIGKSLQTGPLLEAGGWVHRAQVRREPGRAASGSEIAGGSTPGAPQPAGSSKD